MEKDYLRLLLNEKIAELDHSRSVAEHWYQNGSGGDAKRGETNGISEGIKALKDIKQRVGL